MKAVLQNFRTGEMSVAEVPPPVARAGGVLVHNVASLISAGTEKAVIELAKMNPLQKARARPDLVRKVLNRASQEGLLATAQIVMNLVSAPLPLGYSCAGIVREAGSEAGDFQPGDRVACAGLGYANHAEVVFVPRNLAVAIPEGVSFTEAAFVTVGAIALQGVRQADLQVGECVVVMGLGLVGQLTVQLCAAAGCRVFGLDIDPSRVTLAMQWGAEAGMSPNDAEAVSAVRRFSRQRGADAVLITAATPSSRPVEMAAELARDRARVVAVGDVGLNIPRRAYFEKELDLRLSRSYGPGRYDPSYEERGHDYPLGYVRWTENRNMEAFLDLVAQRKVRLDPLMTHRFPIEQAQEAYALLGGKRRESYIGIVLEYDAERPQPATVTLENGRTPKPTPAGRRSSTARFGIIGAGQFAQGILLPRLRKLRNAEIVGVATGNGLTARTVADKYGCRFCTSDYREILSRDDINVVLIATRHNLHASAVIEALTTGKHVFVEKPLALNLQELQAITEAYESAQPSANGRGGPVLLVGYNRRFSPLAAELKKHFSARPLVMNYRVNVEALPAQHWVQDPAVGGGRIVGEVCHFVDLMQFLTDADPVEVFAVAANGSNVSQADPDNLSVQLRFSDGSVGSLMYVSSGDPALPKERLEVFGGGRAGVIDNWRSVQLLHRGRRSGQRYWLTSAKGHAEELAAFVEGVGSGQSPIPFASLRRTSLTTFAMQQSLRTGEIVSLETMLKMENEA